MRLEFGRAVFRSAGGRAADEEFAAVRERHVTAVGLAGDVLQLSARAPFARADRVFRS